MRKPAPFHRQKDFAQPPSDFIIRNETLLPNEIRTDVGEATPCRERVNLSPGALRTGFDSQLREIIFVFFFQHHSTIFLEMAAFMIVGTSRNWLALAITRDLKWQSRPIFLRGFRSSMIPTQVLIHFDNLCDCVLPSHTSIYTRASCEALGPI